MSSTTGSAPLMRALQTSLRRIAKAPKYRFGPATAPNRRQLLVDVSVIVRSDQRTGIQRVVRALLGQLQSMVDSSIIVQPVFASKDHGFCKAVLSPDGTVVNAASRPNCRQPAVARAGDVFLGLDLAAHIFPSVEADLAQWRRDGVSINVVVYDLLPKLRPDWFPSRTVRNFDRWLGVLARQADRCIAISMVVAEALTSELARRGNGRSPDVVTIPMGSDIVASYPSRGLPTDVSGLRTWLSNHRVLLSVGTVEPRKGHHQLLAALEHHWQAEPDSDIALLIVGRPGWKTDSLQAQMLGHPENGNRLIWLDGASDELLTELYGSVLGLVAASHDEGFGLPLLEALAHGTPVLARDLPVFREVGGPLFDYFTDDTPTALASRIAKWLEAPRQPSAVAVATLPRWSDSAAALLRCICPIETATIQGFRA